MPSDLPRPIRVLIADDDALNRRLLREVCAAEGYACDAVGDGSAALAEMRSGGYDLLLVDDAMPEKSGFEVVEALRAEPATAQIPVIMVTANPQDEARVRAELLGVAAYIEKPFRLFDLTHRIRLALRRPRREEDPPTLPGQRIQRAMADVLPHLPLPHQLRPALRRAFEDALAAGRPLCCCLLRLDSNAHLLAVYGRTLRDAVLGVLAVQAAGIAEGSVQRSDENELLWLAPPAFAASLPSWIELFKQAARRVFEEPHPPPVELCLGVVDVPAGVVVVPEAVLREARALATKARRGGEPFATETYCAPEGEEPIEPEDETQPPGSPSGRPA